MEKFFISKAFLYFFLPLFTVALNVFIKIVSRNEKCPIFQKDDIAVGLEVATSALIILLTYCVTIASQITLHLPPGLLSELQEKMVAAPYRIIFLILGLWGTSTIVRFFGWKIKKVSSSIFDDYIEIELKWFIGIILPFIYGILSLFFVINWIQ